MAQPLDKKTLVLKMRKFTGRDGSTGYSLKGSVPMEGGKSLSIDVRCSADGQLKVEEDKRTGKPIVFANAALFKNEPVSGGFARGGGMRKSGSW